MLINVEMRECADVQMRAIRLNSVINNISLSFKIKISIIKNVFTTK